MDAATPTDPRALLPRAADKHILPPINWDNAQGSKVPVARVAEAVGMRIPLGEGDAPFQYTMGPMRAQNSEESKIREVAIPVGKFDQDSDSSSHGGSTPQLGSPAPWKWWTCLRFEMATWSRPQTVYFALMCMQFVAISIALVVVTFLRTSAGDTLPDTTSTASELLKITQWAGTLFSIFLAYQMVGYFG
jgi:hypothetical protein